MKALKIKPNEAPIKISVAKEDTPTPSTGNVFATVKSREIQFNEPVTSTINLSDLPNTTTIKEPTLNAPSHNIEHIVPNTEQILEGTRNYLLKQMPLVYKKAFGVEGNKETLKSFIKEYLEFQKEFTLDLKSVALLSEKLTYELVGFGVLDSIINSHDVQTIHKVHCVENGIWIHKIGKPAYKHNMAIKEKDIYNLIKKLSYVVDYSSENEQLKINGKVNTFNVSGMCSMKGENASLTFSFCSIGEITEDYFVNNIGSRATYDLLQATTRYKKGILITGGSEIERLQMMQLITSMTDNSELIYVADRLAAVKFKEKFTDKPISYFSVEKIEDFKNERVVAIVNDFNELELERILSYGCQGNMVMASLNTPTLQSTLNRLLLMGTKNKAISETLVYKLIENTFKIHVQLETKTQDFQPKIQSISEIKEYDSKNKTLATNELYSLELDTDNLNIQDGSFPTRLIKKHALSEELVKSFLKDGLLTEHMYELASGELSKKLTISAMITKIEENPSDVETDFFHFENKEDA